MIVWLVGMLAAIFALKRTIIYVKAWRDLGHLPHFNCLLGPLTDLGASLPTTWWNPGLAFTYRDRKSLYKNAPSKTIVAMPLLHGPAFVYTSSFHAFKQILAVNAPWVKPNRATDDIRWLSFLGPNVVASEGDIWKRHRRITAPAFTQSAYENVWKVTEGVYSDICVKDGWNGRDVLDIADMNMLTHKVALFVIAICGFGIPMSWASPERDERGNISFEKMVFEVATSILIRSRVPSLAYKLGNKKLNVIEEAYNAFEQLMREKISERQEEIKKLRAMSGGDADIGDIVRDVLGRLVGARVDEGRLALTDDEVISNCFIVMFAGHETTANTLAAALALLGFHQDIQDSVYQSIRNVLGDREPTLDDYDALEDVLACFYEALRLYPAAFLMLRTPTEDTVLSVPRKGNPSIVDHIPIKKGTDVILDCLGCNYDPDVFPDPESFRPSRWTKSSSHSDEKLKLVNTGEAPELSSASSASSLDGFIGFSLGPRTCLGHKFAKVEALCFLTNVLREWRVEVVLNEGETMEMWRERVLKPRFLVTLSFGEVPLRLVRRAKA